MTDLFEPGEPIKAHDYQDIIDNLNPIYGLGTGNTGYGSITSPAADIPSKTVNVDVVQNEDWLILRQAFLDTADHQDITLTDPLPLVSNLEDGDLIGFSIAAAPLFGNFNSAQNITDLSIITLHDGESFTTGLLPGPSESVRTTAWSVQLLHEFSITFDNQDEARAFFNTGGELQLSASRTNVGGSGNPDFDDQNAAWTDFLALNSPFLFTGTEYFLSLTTTYQTLIIFEDITGGPYDIPNPIQWIIQAKTDTIIDPSGRGGKGSLLTFTMKYIDLHVGTDGGPDTVDGTFTSSIVEKRATDIFVKPQPIYTSIIEITAGS